MHARAHTHTYFTLQWIHLSSMCDHTRLRLYSHLCYRWKSESGVSECWPFWPHLYLCCQTRINISWMSELTKEKHQHTTLHLLDHETDMEWMQCKQGLSTDLRKSLLSPPFSFLHSMSQPIFPVLYLLLAKSLKQKFKLEQGISTPK